MSGTDSSEAAVRYPRYNYRDYGSFQPRDTIAETSKNAFLSLGAGFFVAGVKGSLGPPSGAMTAILKNSRYIPLYGAAGTAYTFVECVSANLSESESAWTRFAGGAAAGAVMGSVYRSVPKVVGGALAVGTGLGFCHWAGGFLGYGPETARQNASGDVKDIEKGDRQGFWDVVHRRPLSQTIDELGDLVKPFK